MTNPAKCGRGIAFEVASGLNNQKPEPRIVAECLPSLDWPLFCQTCRVRVFDIPDEPCEQAASHRAAGHDVREVRNG